jgi:hypothetical protein
MLGEVIGQMQQARQHVERARAMIAQALTELGDAEVLIQTSLRGTTDHSLAATVAQTKQHLSSAGQGTTQTTTKIDETLARWRGTGGPGN